MKKVLMLVTIMLLCCIGAFSEDGIEEAPQEGRVQSLQDPVMKSMFETALSGAGTYQEFIHLRDSEILDVNHTTGYLGETEYTYLMDIDFSKPSKAFIYTPIDDYNDRAFLEEFHGGKLSDDVLASFRQYLCFNRFYWLNHMAGNHDFFEGISQYNTVEIEGFQGIGFVELLYGKSYPQLAMAFCAMDNGYVATKLSIIYCGEKNMKERDVESFVSMVCGVWGEFLDITFYDYTL